MIQILAIGVNADLLAARSLVLERTGAHVRAVFPEAALALLQTDFFDIVVVASSSCLLPSRPYGMTSMARANPAELVDHSLRLLQGAMPQPHKLSTLISFGAA